MNEFDRAFIMERIGVPGGSLERLIEMAYEGNLGGTVPLFELRSAEGAGDELER